MVGSSYHTLSCCQPPAAVVLISDGLCFSSALVEVMPRKMSVVLDATRRLLHDLLTVADWQTCTQSASIAAVLHMV